MPAGQGKDERFAAAVDRGRPSAAARDDEFRRELEIAELLGRGGPALSPDRAASARMKNDVMAAFDAMFPAGAVVDPVRSANPVDVMADTVPLGAPLGAAPTEVIPVLRLVPDPDEDPAWLATDAADETPDDGTHGDGTHEDETHDDETHDDEPATVAPGRHRFLHGAGRDRSAPSIRRRVTVTAAAASLAMVALAAGGVFASRDALPGDATYGVKRAAEGVGLALTWSDNAKAKRHFELAETRLTEVERLLAAGSPDAAALTTTLGRFDSETGAGSRLLLGSSMSRSSRQLDGLQNWADAQSGRLAAMPAGLPVGARDSSAELLDRLATRSEALRARTSCQEFVAGSDDLGYLPAQGTCSPRSAATGEAGVEESPLAADAPGTADRTSRPSGSASETPTSGGTDPSGTEDASEETSSTSGSTQARGGTEGSATSGSSSGSSVPTSTSPAPVRVPLPIPRVSLPALVPGGPGITLG